MSIIDVPQLEKIRHSAEHVLTTAMLRIYGPEAILPAMGPATDDGFYFDFAKGDPTLEISEKDFPKIEKELGKIINAGWIFKNFAVPSSEAIDFYPKNQYKRELITDLLSNGQTEVTFYVLGPAEKVEQLAENWWLDTNWDEVWAKQEVFIDLCKGPHVVRTNEIGAFKLTKMAGAYWRGDENREMLVRIYGTAFATREELDEYLWRMEEARKRDHKRLGRELDYYSFDSDAPGAVFWHEKGMVLWDLLEKFGQDLRSKHGFVKIKTPEMAKSKLWVTSGHWDHYQDDMFKFEVDEGETYCLKPMDCPFNIKIYQTQQRSYRDLPIRYTEIGHVFRNEKSGELNGLFRVREITQDDSHIMCREDQVGDEIKNLLSAVKSYYQALGLQPEYFLSTMPDDHLGEVTTWNKAEADLIEALTAEEIAYDVKEKDGAFYGPKIDVDIKDALGRRWQVATIQLDFQLPGRFGCEYVDVDGKKVTPVMIHAAIFGSFERMIGILMEHYAGRLPLWLSPVQVRVLPVTDRHNVAALEVVEKLRAAGFRAEIDASSERLGAKIRAVEVAKIPCKVVVGDKEMERGEYQVEFHEEQVGELGGQQILIMQEALTK